MKRTWLVAGMLISSIVFAQGAAPAAPPAAPAVGEADCDMHKAQAAMMKDVAASKAKMVMVKLDSGTTGIITADKKSAPAVEKAMASMDGPMKDAMEGKGKLCDECKNQLAAMKAGKVMMGHGREGMVWTMTTLSSDPEVVKKMHAMCDQHAAQMGKGKAAK